MYFTLNFIIAQLLVQVIGHECFIKTFCDVGSTFTVFGVDPFPKKNWFLSKDIH